MTPEFPRREATWQDARRRDCTAPVSSAALRLFSVACLLATCLAPSSARAEEVSAQSKEAIVIRIGELLEELYVFPEVAETCGVHLRSQLAAGAFNGLNDPQAFADSLTDTLRSVSDDKHMLVHVRPPERARLEEDDPEAAQLRREYGQRETNFGFERVERLEGNIGYVDMRSFAPLDLGRDTAAAAMQFVANSDALIFDMRENGGGYPRMVQFVCSYFFSEPTHLNSLYWREGDRTEEFWTLDDIPGTRMPDVPLFVLTSPRTFSGAEEFSYNLRTRDRATLIGESTKGGANPGRFVVMDERFGIVIPTGRAINPVTGTNWEGVGVEPHIAVAAEDALARALTEARPAAEAYGAARFDRELALRRQGAERDGQEKGPDPYFMPTESRTSPYMPRVIIRNIREDADGKIWFATFGGPICYDGEAFTNYSEEVGLAKTRVFSLLEDRSGALWFGSITGGASRYDGRSHTLFTTADGLPSDDVNWIFEDRAGSLWFGTEHGVSRYDGESFTNFDTEDGLVHNSVYAITQDSAGTLWFGTQGGVCSYDGEAFSNLSDRVGVPFVNVRAMVADRSGGLWFGGQQGLFHYGGRGLSIFTEKEGLLHDFVGSMILDRAGNLWLGHPDVRGGGATRYDGKSFTHFTTKEGLSSTNVYCLLEDSAGNIWFGSADAGACRYDGSSFTNFSPTVLLGPASGR